MLVVIPLILSLNTHYLNITASVSRPSFPGYLSSEPPSLALASTDMHPSSSDFLNKDVSKILRLLIILIIIIIIMCVTNICLVLCDFACR